jgi:TonB-linked SusC/RagA family outer membrane protein
MVKHLTSILLCLLSFGLSAQISVTGTVSDGIETLIGATVREKGTPNGTATKDNGTFEIKVSDKNAILEISYVGYKNKELRVGSQTNFNIILESADAMQEVIVVGYGTQKKSVTTGAISKVRSSDLENMPVSRLEQSLSGRTSGVRVTANSGAPNSAATVRIRGTTTINDSEPLYIVDGVPIGGGIDYLNQSDIESIEVLKDAASAAIYGARSANGVIIVTTKKGRAESTEINYNAYYGTQKPWRKLDLLNAQEYAMLMNEASVNAGGGELFQDVSAFGEGTDWQAAIFNESAPIQNHELSISTGSERSQYYASFGYFDQTGIVTSSSSRAQRFSVRFNSTHKLKNWLTVGNTLGYSRNTGKGIPDNSEYSSPLMRAINLDPLTPLIETREDVLSSPVFVNFPVVRDENGQPYGISTYVTSEGVNPVAAVKVNQGYGWGDKIAGNVFADIKLLEGLKFRTSYGVDFGYWGNEAFSPVHYLNTTNRVDINRYGRGLNRGNYWIWENTASYERQFGKHKGTLLVGTVAERNQGSGTYGSIQGIPVNDIADASLAYPVPNENKNFSGYEYQGALLSYLGRLNYSYDGKYLLSALFRRDGSPKFGENYRFGTFPSVSAGWVVTEENFFDDNNAVNFLKIRGSWGVNGNDKIGDFRFVSTVGGARNYTFGLPEELVNGATPNALANPDLRWEETTQTNVGFDAKLFRHWNLSFDWFNKKTTGMLLTIAVPGYVGNAGPIGNIASMKNTGFELELGLTKNIGKFQFELSGNASYVKNEVTNLGDDKDYLVGQTFTPQGLEITRTSVGQPYGYFFGYEMDGIFQNETELANYNRNGVLLQPDAVAGDIRFKNVVRDSFINALDRTFLGNSIPTWTYGFTLVSRYKSFDLTLFGQGVAGNKIFNATRRFDLLMANMTTEALGRWTGEGSTNTFPRLTMNDRNNNFSRSSDFFLENGAFLRVKTLQLGYTLPLRTVSRIGMRKLRFYVSGNNLFTFTAYKGFDPEIGGGSYGVDRGIYPAARFWLVGVNVGL